MAHHEGAAGYRKFMRFTKLRRDNPNAKFHELADRAEMRNFQRKRGFKGNDSLSAYADKVASTAQLYDEQLKGEGLA